MNNNFENIEDILFTITVALYLVSMVLYFITLLAQNLLTKVKANFYHLLNF